MTKSIRALFVLPVLLVALVAAGCGSSGSGGSGTDTAKVAPASSFLYFEATIDPTGSQEAAVRTILADLPGTGAPQDRINNLLEQASKTSKTAHVDYAKDIKPWLGDKAAVFVAPPAAGSKSPPWGVVVATTDEGKTKDAINNGKEAGDRSATYNGTDYVVSKDGTATAVVGGFFIVGSEAGLKAAVDATKTTSLSESDRYKQATKNATTDRLALVYEDLGGLVQTLAGASGQSLGPAAPLLGQFFGGQPLVATIRAETQALIVDGALIPKNIGISAKSTPLLGDVPADSWLAFGLTDFGNSLKKVIGLVAGAVGGAQNLEQQLRSQTGLDLNRDVLGWIGDVAFFVSGDSKDTIGGGALIQSKDPATSKNTLTKLAALAAKAGPGTRVSAFHSGNASGYKIASSSLPNAIYVAEAGDKVAITYGEAAAKAVLEGTGGGLTSAPGYKDASAKLGEGYAPSLYASIPPILNLAESFGAGGASYAKAKPYLTVFDYLIAGSAGDNSRLRIGFKPHG